jgi:hypothetical protein
VVAILLATGVVDSRRLDMPAFLRTDPDVLPGRRDGALVSLQHLAVVDRLSVVADVREPASAPDPVDPLLRAIDAAQVWHGGHIPVRRYSPSRAR